VSDLRLVVIGGAGFIGANIIRLWAQGDFLSDICPSITVLDNGSTDGFSRVEHFEQDHSGVTVLRVDAREFKQLVALLHPNDLVIFLAANPDISKGASQPRLDFEHGTVVAETVAEACRTVGVKYLLFTSGSGVYGDSQGIVFSEKDVTTDVVSPYAASKVAVEALFSAYAMMFRMNIGIVRFANVVGPMQSHGVAFDFIKRLRLHPKELQVLGDGNQLKSYVHVNDALAAVQIICREILGKTDYGSVEIYNVSSEDRITVRDIALTVIQEMKLFDCEIKFQDAKLGWLGDVADISMDSSKIRDTHAWTPAFGSQQAIQDAVKNMLEDS
jgi:UDP-glucose 4-epimerase